MLANTKWNVIKVLISKALFYLYINHGEFASVNNVLREYNETKEEIKFLTLQWNILYNMVDISRDIYNRNGVAAIADGVGILWLNEKHVEKKKITKICAWLQENRKLRP